MSRSTVGMGLVEVVRDLDRRRLTSGPTTQRARDIAADYARRRTDGNPS
jgi:hypothetical protein